MYCSRCGQYNQDDSKFCNKCGAPLSGAPNSASGGKVAVAERKPGLVLSKRHKALIFSWAAMIIAFMFPYGYVSVSSHGNDWSLFYILFNGDLTETIGLWLFVASGLFAAFLCFKSQYQLAHTMQLISFALAATGHIFFATDGNVYWRYSTFSDNICLGYFVVVAVSAFQYFTVRRFMKEAA